MVFSDFINIAVGNNDITAVYAGDAQIWAKGTYIRYTSTTAPRFELTSSDGTTYAFEADTSIVKFSTANDATKSYELKITGDTLTSISEISGIDTLDLININAALLTELNLNAKKITASDNSIISGGNSLKITLSDTDSATKGYVTTILGNSGYSYTWDGDSILNCTK